MVKLNDIWVYGRKVRVFVTKTNQTLFYYYEI